jgi:ABC-type proline/glycine betaine transport system permease subunit
MGSGLIAGGSIVLMATILDRVTQGRRAEQGAPVTV